MKKTKRGERKSCFVISLLIAIWTVIFLESVASGAPIQLKKGAIASTQQKKKEPAEAKLLWKQAHKLFLGRQAHKAKVLAKRALTIAQRALGPEHAEVAKYVILLADCYNSEGSYEKAEPLYLQALVIQEKAFGPETLAVAYPLADLAKIYNHRGDYGKAEPLYQRALDIRDKDLRVKEKEYLERYGPLPPGPLPPSPLHPLLISLAEVNYRLGNYAKAESIFQRVLAITEKESGPESLEVADALNSLAVLYKAKGDYAKAESFFQRSLTIAEKTLGSENPEMAPLLDNFAELYKAKGDHERAFSLFQQSLAIREKTLGSEHLDVADSLHGLADMYQIKGDQARAESFYQRALSIKEKKLGSEHVELASIIHNLARLHLRLGNYTKAEPLSQRALAIAEKALGPEHYAVAASLDTLALLYSAKGDYTKAEPLSQRSLAIREKVFGIEHPAIAASLNNLAELYKTKGDYTKAEPLLQRTLALIEKALGSEHTDVATSINNLAGLYRAKGDYTKAELFYQRALTIGEKVFGPEHLEVATSLNNLAGLYQAKGDHAQAEPLYRRALAITEKALSQDHSNVAIALSGLAELYRAEGDYTKAESLCQRALVTRERALGPEHPSVAISLNNFATVYSTKGDYARAEPLYQRALVIQEKALDLEHPEVARSLNNLAFVQYFKGEYTRAELLYQRALAIWEKVLGPNHPDVATSLSNLALLYEAKGDTGRAIALQSRGNEIREHNLNLNLAAGSERQKFVYLETLRGETYTTVSLHLQSAPNDPKARQLALLTVLRFKGRGLDATTDSLSALRRRLNPQDQGLLNQFAEICSRLATLSLRGPEKTDPARHQTEIESLEDAREKLEAEVSQRSAEFRAQFQSVKLETVQATIPDRAALVDFFFYYPFNAKSGKWESPRYVAYVLSQQGEPDGVDLGEARTIDGAIEGLRAALRDPKRADVKPLARALDEKVMRPVRKLLGETRRVLLSPDGALNLVAFAALVDEQQHYLAEQYTFSYLTSGRDLLRLQAAPENKQPPLVMANPDFDLLGSAQGAESASRLLTQTKPSGQSPGNQPPQKPQATTARPPETLAATLAQITAEPLPATADEAQAIKALLPGAIVLTGTQATEAALKQTVAPSLLHIATHGFFLEDSNVGPPPDLSQRLLLQRVAEADVPVARLENPLLRSGLILAGFNQHRGGADDGVLTAMEAASLNLLGTRMVILSACDTGVGEVKNGDGVYGLRRALVLAGSETQVMSLWPVSDKGTQELMIAYYKGLLAKQGRSEALRQVQLQMMANPKRQHPYYWASFIVSGEWANLDGKR